MKSSYDVTDWRVDSLRGYFLVLMTLAHLPQHPLQRFSSYTFGYASAPDDLCFFSWAGVHLGLLRARNKHGQHALGDASPRRTRDVYLVHIILLSASVGGAVLLITLLSGCTPGQTFVSGSLLRITDRLATFFRCTASFFCLRRLWLDQMMKGRPGWWV